MRPHGTLKAGTDIGRSGGQGGGGGGGSVRGHTEPIRQAPT